MTTRRVTALAIITLAMLAIARPAEARGCPRHLGCGCHLASYLRILEPHEWRELWVARNWLRRGEAARHGCVGCVAVLSRGRGGHVGVVRGYDSSGNPVIYSWANARLGWTQVAYPRRRVLGYRQMGSGTFYSASLDTGYKLPPVANN